MYEFILTHYTYILIGLTIFSLIVFYLLYHHNSIKIDTLKSKMPTSYISLRNFVPIINQNATVKYNTLPNGMTVITIDNVLKNIDELTNDKMIKCIDSLLNIKNNSNPNYPGTQKSIRNTNENFLNEIKALVRGHSEFQKIQSTSNYMDISIGHEFKSKGSTDNPHVDSHIPGMYASLIYLNKPDNCWGGTDIFRSKILNRYTWPIYKKAPEIKDINDVFDKIYNKPDGYNLKKNCGSILNDKEWEVVKHFKMKYNRMIIYESNLFHNLHLDTFERFKNKKRYTLNFWFDKLPFVRRDYESYDPEELLKNGHIDEKSYTDVIEKDKKNMVVAAWIYMKYLT